MGVEYIKMIKDRREYLKTRKTIDCLFKEAKKSGVSECSLLGENIFSIIDKVFNGKTECDCSYYAINKCCNSYLRDYYFKMKQIIKYDKN